MTATRSPSPVPVAVSETVDPFEATRLRTWLILLAIAFLWHLFFFWFQPSWRLSPAPPPKIEIQQVDPQKLEAIRRQWRNRQEPKQLLLDKNKDQPKTETEAPPDARYFSDRNIRVEKEQRARDTNVIPKSGSPSGAENPSRTQQAQPKPEQAPPQSKTAKRPLKLGDLGLPMKLAPQKPTQANAQRKPGPAQRANNAVPLGGDQAVSDPNLPQGSENLLNAQESVYYSFYARLYESIGPIWQSRIRDVPYRRRVQPGNYSTVVDITLDRNGRLVSVEQTASSGIEEFDQAVQSSWRKVGSFPNPPQGLLDQNGQVHVGWTFTVEVGAGFNLQYLPPERNY